MPTFKETTGSKKKHKDVGEYNRMKLFGMSNDNQLYFFQDSLNFSYWVYKLINSTKKRDVASDFFGDKKIGFLKNNAMNTSSSTRQNYTDIYDLVPQYEVKIFDSHIITDKFNISKGYDNAEQRVSEYLETGLIKT